MKNNTILYIGGFILPNKNAAAQRVISNAKALKKLGYNVVFINYSSEVETKTMRDYYGFTCYEFPKRSEMVWLTSIDDVKEVCDTAYVDSVIAYNYPAVALKKIIKYAHSRDITCYGDVSEWYKSTGNILHRLLKYLDTEFRMKVLNFKLDGVIAISKFLYDYYAPKVNTIQVPPLVDVEEIADKTSINSHWFNADEATTKFVYSGSPSKQKECLDTIVKTVEKLSAVKHVKLLVVGVTKAQYEEIYQTVCENDCIEFAGRVSHIESMQAISEADWSIIIRENNWVVRAGFPTKLAESMGCGVPVVINAFSNVVEYLDDKNSIVSTLEGLFESLSLACERRLTIDKSVFDYRAYINEFKKMFSDCN